MFPETKSRETLRFEGNKIQICYIAKQMGQTDGKQIVTLLTNDVVEEWAVNISWVTVNCFLFDVIVFEMLPAHGIWQEKVSLLDVMWQ